MIDFLPACQQLAKFLQSVRRKRQRHPPHASAQRCSLDDRITLCRLVRNQRPQTSPPVRERQEEAGGYWLKSFFIAPTFFRAAPFNWSFFPSSSRSRLPERPPSAFFDLSFDLVCQTFDFIFCARLHDVSSKQVDSPKWISRKARSPHFGFGPHTRQIGSRASTYVSSKPYARRVESCCF